MEVGIKQAKNDLSQLVIRVSKGERVFLMNRGKRVAELIPVQSKKRTPAALRGYGMFRDVITLPPDWGTQETREQDERELLAMIEGAEA